AFCTILNYGLGTAEEEVARVVSDGIDGVDEPRLKVILEFALKVNADAKSVTDTDPDALRALGLTVKGIVQLVHLVSDVGAYNRLNLALDTDYDYRDQWRSLAFGWEQKSGSAAGDNARGFRG
ncbi:MAG: carboxymuconolactone decarboxylase family protein, partial [Gammaproteobacteria bacterium]|nr:carboxymuconolactone decarboxylase family protein [Gammaproteobacteria bacterium]